MKGYFPLTFSLSPAIFLIVFVKKITTCTLVTPEKLPISRKYFSRELSPILWSRKEYRRCFLLCLNIIENFWPADNHLNFRKSSKDLACWGLSKIRSPLKFIWRSVLRVSRVRLWKKIANHKSTENFSSILGHIYLIKTRSFFQ